MSIEQLWGAFFKSEVKTSGQKLFAQEKVSISNGSDTSIQAYVRASPPLKVRFSTEDVGSESFSVECTCPPSKRGQFCKHIWATLLSVEGRYPDFLDSKRVIEKTADSVTSDDSIEPEVSYQAKANLRAAAYRKEQYQKQKERAKALKHGTKDRGSSHRFRALPENVEQALAYFTKNGFPMPAGPDDAVVSEAKKKLSRVFHPDKGGSTEEMVELNQNCDLLARFLQHS